MTEDRQNEGTGQTPAGGAANARRVVTYTHTGFFGLCPVYLAGLDSNCPDLDVRHWSLAWLLTVSEWMLGSMIWFRTAIDPLYEPEWPIVVTGRLSKPVVRHG